MAIPLGTKTTLYDQDGYKCPHCEAFNAVCEVGCGKVRCGMHANAQGQERPIDFHLTDDMVSKLNIVYGCGKVFQLAIDRPAQTERVKRKPREQSKVAKASQVKRSKVSVAKAKLDK